MVDYREDAKWTVYVHIVPKELSGYDWDKYYFGITSRKVSDRWKNGNGYKQCKLFWNAVKKYGWNNIIHEILFENVETENAKRIEKICISLYKSNNPKYGYNISAGGDGITGIRRYGESNSFYGKRHTEETRRKMSENHKDCFGENNSMYGKTHSDEVKIKISESKKDYYRNNPVRPIILTEELKKQIGKRHSKIIQRFDFNMNLIAEYDSLLALEKLGYRRASIRDVCLGRKDSYKDSIWKYKNIEDKWENGYIVGTNSDNIYCLDDKYNTVGIYKSYSEASRFTDIHRRVISNACNNKDNHFAHRYYWLFKEDYELFSSGLLSLCQEV